MPPSFGILGLLERPPLNPTFEEARKVHLCSLGVVSAKAGGKPPPESKERTLRCEAVGDIDPKAKGQAGDGWGSSICSFG